MIVILDYEMGNVGSIQNMLRKIGVREVTISRDAGDIRRADRLILPGWELLTRAWNACGNSACRI